MSRDTSTSFNERSTPVEKNGAVTAPAPVLPLDDYIAELEECGLSHEQASEYLATLVPLIWHFVDLGYRGDISELLLPSDDSGAVDSKDIHKTKEQLEAGKEVAAE